MVSLTPVERPEPRQQFFEGKQFDQVVVGAGIETGHAVGHGVAVAARIRTFDPPRRRVRAKSSPEPSGRLMSSTTASYGSRPNFASASTTVPAASTA